MSAAWGWFADHVLPGLIVAGMVGVSHAHLWRRIKRLADEVRAEVKDGSDGKGGPSGG